jgi:DNA-binding GntR family transcriptional regulator
MQFAPIAFVLGIHSASRRFGIQIECKKGVSTDKPTLAETLAEAIAAGILNGTLPPGERLDEMRLAEQHGVSRTPVREALRQLAMSGLIEMRPRKGAIVTKVTPEQLESLFVAMAEMEATCARLAAMSMTPIERRRLQARHEKMMALAAAGDIEAYSDANVAFHSSIYAGAHNAPLAEYALALRRRVGPFRRAQFQIEGRLTRSNKEHDAVVRAIVSGDVAGAHAAMLHHVSLVEDAFETFSATAAA